MVAEYVLWLVLKRCRENRGLSQREAAAKTGVGQTVIARLESGRQGVREDMLAKIAAGYGVTIRELLLEGLADDRPTDEDVFDDDASYAAAAGTAFTRVALLPR